MGSQQDDAILCAARAHSSYDTWTSSTTATMPTRRAHRSVRALGTLQCHLGGKQLPTVKDFISVGGLDSTDRHCYLRIIAGGRQMDSRESRAAAATIALATRDGLHDE
jgi:hypothetical protein